MTPAVFAQATGLPINSGWYESVRAALNEFDIATPVRIAAFLAQVGHESAGFRHVREIWGPTAAQNRYDGRNGNTMPGDGFRFRGRGLIQITGRANYAEASEALRADLIKQPELLEQPMLAARSAAWFWSTRNCNAFADRGDFEGLTRRINGGINGLPDRERRWKIARAALGLSV